jgi:hypothetical protein
VDPGVNGPGVLHSSADVTFESGSTFHTDVNGSLPGTEIDQLNVTGNGLGSGALFSPPGDPEQFEILYGPSDVFVVHQNTGSAFQNRSITSSVTEGSVATLRGTIVEPDRPDSFILEVTWGDGSPTQTFTFPPGSNGQQVQVTHTYVDEGVYTAHLFWHDQHGAGNSTDMQVVVTDVAPTVDAGGDVVLPPGGVLNRTGSFTDPGADTWTVTVDYGDGSGVQALALDDQQFRLHHNYQAPGTYQVTVTVREDGGVGTATFLVTVPSHGRQARDALFALLGAGQAEGPLGGSPPAHWRR